MLPPLHIFFPPVFFFCDLAPSFSTLRKERERKREDGHGGSGEREHFECLFEFDRPSAIGAAGHGRDREEAFTKGIYVKFAVNRQI
jgi:hypothetical protein